MDDKNSYKELFPLAILGFGSIGSLAFLYWLIYYLTS
jgi:hypothetical protein